MVKVVGMVFVLSLLQGIVIIWFIEVITIAFVSDPISSAILTIPYMFTAPMALLFTTVIQAIAPILALTIKVSTGCVAITILLHWCLILLF